MTEVQPYISKIAEMARLVGLSVQRLSELQIDIKSSKCRMASVQSKNYCAPEVIDRAVDIRDLQKITRRATLASSSIGKHQSRRPSGTNPALARWQHNYKSVNNLAVW